MIGTTLSHYDITAELGRGGMGIVYRARDTKLDRDVAIKILPSAALASSDDRERFYREAKSAAQLHHPNIASVFEIDEAVPEGGDAAEPRPFIAMEFIEGQTLHDIVKKGPLKLSDAVKIASQVAEALKAAHAKDIVHRDIKSANVMITEEGVAKVLDFGLAKTNQSTMLTRMGSTLGTVAYMSPEQARGQEVDGRTDLYSLGTMLYETVAGKLPFAGEYEQAVVYGILNESPEPLTAVRTGVPMQLEWIVNKLLAKDADYRYQTAGDLLADLKALDLSGSGMSRRSMPAVSAAALEAAPATGTGPAWSIRTVGAVGAVALIVGLAVGFALFNNSPEPEALKRVSITLPEISNVRFLSMSPTGDYLAFVGQSDDGNSGVFLRDMSSGELRYVEGTETAGRRDIGFSPDGSKLAITDEIGQGVLIVLVPAGLPQREVDEGRFLFWDSEDAFVYGANSGHTIRKTLGVAQSDTIRLEEGVLEGDYQNIWKTIIPGTDIAFGHQMVIGPGAQTEVSSLVRTRLKNGSDVKVLESPIMNPAWVDGGFLVYNQRNDSGKLVVRQVDESSGELVGAPMDALPEGDNTTWSYNVVTPDGDLIYINQRGVIQTGEAKLFVVNPTERESIVLPITIPAGADLEDVDISPDGNQLAFVVEDSDSDNIYVFDMTSRNTTQITFEDRARDPVWSADGDWIYYSSQPPGSDSNSGWQVNRIRPFSASAPDSITAGFAQDISTDGDLLALGIRENDSWNLWVMNLRTSEKWPVVQSEPSSRTANFSPDDNVIAYTSHEGPPVVRITSLDGTRNSKVSDEASMFPRWSPDGKYLYVSSMVTRQYKVQTSPTYSQTGEPETMFYGGALFPGGLDMFPDGERFAAIWPDIRFDTAEQEGTELVWLQNWSDHLKRKFAE